MVYLWTFIGLAIFWSGMMWLDVFCYNQPPSPWTFVVVPQFSWITVVKLTGLSWVVVSAWIYCFKTATRKS